MENDYYELEDRGCCLLCKKAYPGCLCYSCKCKKCFWYVPPEFSGEFDSFGKPKGSCNKKFER